MQPADRLGPQVVEVAVTVGQQAQHRGVIDRSHDTEPAVP
jgi:hypothetical protein